MRSRAFVVAVVVLSLAIVVLGGLVVRNYRINHDLPARAAAPTSSTVVAVESTTTTLSVLESIYERATSDPTELAYLRAVDAAALRTLGDTPQAVLDDAKQFCDDGQNGQPADPSTGDRGQTPEEMVATDLTKDSSRDGEDQRVARLRLAAQDLCPNIQPVVRLVDAGVILKMPPLVDFGDGTYKVGVDIKPGTYAINTTVTDCYWDRTDASGNTIANNFITGAPQARVTISSSDTGFTSNNCGLWMRQ